MILATLGLILLGLVQPDLPIRRSPHADVDLYARFVAFARHPASFYASAIAEQRREGYPLHPFVVVRPPALAFILAILPNDDARRWAIQALAAGVVFAWGVRLHRLGFKPTVIAIALLALVTGELPSCVGRAFLFHEAWAGLLIALSLAVYTPGTWRTSAGLGLVAALIRELAAPYLLVMGLLALMEGRRREAAGWAAAVGVFVVALALHAWMVHLNVLPADRRGPGWAHMSGWAFVLKLDSWNLLLAGEPQVWTALAAPWALFGAVAWGGATGRRLGLTVIGFTAGFLFIGRPENTYWGLLTTPLEPLALVLGLYLAPGLMRRALSPTSHVNR